MQLKFFYGIAAGFIIMVILSFILAPACAVAGAAVAAMMVPGRIKKGIMAGLVTGILGIVMILATYFLRIDSLFGQLWGMIQSIGMPFLSLGISPLLASIFVFFIVSGVIGGAIGGWGKRYVPAFAGNQNDSF